MKTEQQIENEIKSIKYIQKELRLQGREDEAKYWDDIIYYLDWCLN